MVQEVENIINGYSMGELRALAQDPVQNSLDARANDRSIVRVEYQLHNRRTRNGTPVWVLTVTDTGTTGLNGHIITPAELQRRGYRLESGENWAAFEAQGFTKSSLDKIGSRGQGKSAFLYHSEVPTSSGSVNDRRMIMLYDTLLSNGEYRLGVRFASPADTIRTPPFRDFEAREIVQSRYFKPSEQHPDLELPMGFRALERVGTRIIVPFLSSSATEAMSDRTMLKWLQRCWWRPIQQGQLEIALKFPGRSTEFVKVPRWWEGEPWLVSGTKNMREFTDIKIDPSDGVKQIERLVLLYEESLEAPEELHSTYPEYSGIQLLRHGQWVETLGAKQDFPDIIPFARRGQFRGFAEFNEPLNRTLRAAERPQHDALDGRWTEVKQIRAKIEEHLRTFARGQGWEIADEIPSATSDTSDTELMENIIASFITPEVAPDIPESGSGATTEDPQLEWDLKFAISYPSNTARVDWGQSITGIQAKCLHRPSNRNLNTNFRLELKGPSGRFRTLQQKFADTSAGKATVDFDDLQVVEKVNPFATGTLFAECPEPGEYQLRASLLWNGDIVKTIVNHVYVEIDPPPPPDRNRQTLSLRVVNLTQGVDLTQAVSRINSGDAIEVVVTASNRDHKVANCSLDASVRASGEASGPNSTLLLADELRCVLQAAGPSGVPQTEVVLKKRFRIFSIEPKSRINVDYVVLPSGRHRLSADLYTDGSDDTPAHASKVLYVEISPIGEHRKMPFRFNPIDKADATLWALRQDPVYLGEWTLDYNRASALYQQTVGDSGTPSAKQAFYGYICVEALIDWALTPYLEKKDESNMTVLRRAVSSFNNTLWQEQYEEAFIRIVDKYGTAQDPAEFAVELGKCRGQISGIMSGVLRTRMSH
jgi:hypothetical protein